MLIPPTEKYFNMNLNKAERNIILSDIEPPKKERININITIPNDWVISFYEQSDSCRIILSYLIFTVLFAIFDVPFVIIVILYLLSYALMAYRTYNVREKSLMVDPYQKELNTWWY